MEKIYENCKYCSKSIEIKNSDPSRGSLHNHISRCVVYKNYKKSILTEEIIRRYYEIEKMSANEISSILNLPVGAIISSAKSYGIKTRSISESKLEKRCKDKVKNTNLLKYGSPHNFSKSHPSRIQWQARLLEEEGITTVFQRQEVIDKITETIAARPLSAKNRVGSRISLPHKQVYKFITEELKIENCKIEYPMQYDNVTKRKKFYDIFVPSKNLIIEINGDQNHANPKLYKANDLVNYFHFKEPKKVLDIWTYDNFKINLALQQNFHVLILWECDINKNWNNISDLIKQIFNEDCDENYLNQICNKSIEYLKKI